ncbi:MAG: hypothetical protein JW957_02460 [Candidatus Omnitrophica bacterium]|nr:hypothetical protein [Candidatus Omnitrophota bacterium]
MQKMQKAGFIISASTFVAIGLIFLIAGIAAENRTLKTMGAIWLPLGIINFLFVMLALKREK